MLRQILEMPTTDPGGDCFNQFLTTEDDDSDIDDSDGYPRIHRGMLRADGTRKPMMYDSMRLMPPELIIRSAKVSCIHRD